MQEDPPHFANVKNKIEKLHLKQDIPQDPNMNIHEEVILHLKTQGINLKSQFFKLDKAKKGTVSFEEFKKIIENTNLPKNLKKNINKIYIELGGSTGGINYKEILSKIESNRLPDISGSQSYENRLKIIEKKTAPLNQLEKIYTNARAIRQFLKHLYNTPEALLKDLQQTSANNCISMENLKKFVIDKAADSEKQKITKKEVEGFLASYDYNKDSQTGIDEVASYVFMDDILAANHLHNKKRAIPPIRESSKLENIDLKRLKILLTNIEEKMFVQGPLQSLPVFRYFDRDADGYITLEDISKGLKLSQIEHTDQDCLTLVGFLDENKNGYVTYSEFSNKMQLNILTVNHKQLQESEDKHFNIAQPSIKYHLYQQSRLQKWKPIGSNEDKLQLTTRFSATPDHQNTFSNFEASTDSAMYVSDNERLFSKKFSPININHEDKNRLRTKTNAKIIYLKKTRENQDKWIKEIDEKETARDNQKITKRTRVKNEYEVKCKTRRMD